MNALLHFLANHIEYAFQIFSISSRNKHLFDSRFGGQSFLSQNLRTGGHGPDVHQRKSFPLHLFYQHTEYAPLFGLVLGQENQAGAITPLFRHGNTLQQNKFVGYLQHDTCTVARFVVSSFCSTVLHVFQHLQRGINQFVAFITMNIDNHAHTASIVLIIRPVKPLV